MLSAKEVALAVTKALDEKKGQDIKLLRIDRVSSLADYFLICTGTSNTHVNRGNSWELLDFGSIVVHVFTEEARKFYDLERLWADAEFVDLKDIVLPN